jgi:transcriptional activator SPT8
LANGDADKEDDDMLNGTRVSVSVGPDFDKPKSTDTGADTEKPPDSAATITDAGNEVNGKAEGEADGDVAMSDAPSPFDPLFDDEDADGETVIPSGEVTMAGTPAINDMVPPSPAKPKPGSGLALPGSKPIKQEAPVSAVPSSAPSGSSTPLFNMPQPVASSSKTAAANIPILSPADFRAFSDDIFLTSSMDGQVVLIDRRVPDYGGSNGGVGRLQPSEKAPPWCMSACWSGDGTQILAGRRNGTIDIWDVRRHSTSSSPSLLRTLRTPAESGPVSCVVALPDGQHVATASQDNVRLWNTAEYFGPEESIKRKGSRPPFKIIAGHHGGTISSMRMSLHGRLRGAGLITVVDPTCRFLTTASGDRGWQGEATKVVLIHEIKW